jgi:oligoribonuclease
MSTAPEKALVWIDVETSGLDASTETLLEVACLVTDLDLNILDGGGYQSTILWAPQEIARLRANADPFVQDMHEGTGLWAKCSNPERSLPVEVVEANLLAYITALVPERRTARCAGNSVRLDLNFLDRWLPAVTAHLHYRMLDVSTLTGAAQWWGGIEPMEKERQHTAMADIRESIAEARYLRANLFGEAR